MVKGPATRLVLAAVCVVLIAGSSLLAGCSSDQPDLSGLPAYDPLSILTLRSGNFQVGEEYTITFGAQDGYKATLVVQCEDAGEIEVAVPLHMSPLSNESGPTPVIARVNSEAFAFLANDLPELGSAPGEGLVAGWWQSLVASQSALSYLETMAATDGNQVDLGDTISKMTEQITSQENVLATLITNGELTLTDGTTQISLSGDDLTLADRILYAQCSSVLQGRVDSIDLRKTDQADSGDRRNADGYGVFPAALVGMVPQGTDRTVSFALQDADQVSSDKGRNPDWDRVWEEVTAYYKANGPDRFEVLNQAMLTQHVGPHAPLDLEMDRRTTASAYAAALTGVGMAWAAMAELTSSRGASDPGDCQKLAEGMSSMETALKLMEISSWESAHATYGVLVDAEAFRSWNEDGQAMLDSMRSWASQYCPEQAPGSSKDGYAGDSGTGATGTTTSIETSLLRFDGFYRTGGFAVEGESGALVYYLRFYADGTVISAATNGDPEAVPNWFTQENVGTQGVVGGTFDVDGDRLSFSLDAASGTVDYEGTIDGDNLSLDWYSNITGAGGHRDYHF